MKPALGRRTLFAALIAVSAAASFYGYYLHAATPPHANTGLQRFVVEVQGRQRQFSVFAPPQRVAGSRMFVALHSSMSTGDELREQTGGILERLATRDGAVIVYPDGIEGHFNDCRRMASYSARTLNIDDVAFLRAIVDRMVVDLQVDRQRVDALGYSNGAQMAYRLAVEAGAWIRGVVMVAANVPAPDNMDCPTQALPSRRVVLISGTLDPINPHAGGTVTLFGFGNRGRVLSAMASAEWFSQRLGLSPGSQRTLEPACGVQVRQQDWSGDNGQVRLVTLTGGGHTIPQSDYRFPRLLGRTYMKDAILASAWQMLDD